MAYEELRTTRRIFFAHFRGEGFLIGCCCCSLKCLDENARITRTVLCMYTVLPNFSHIGPDPRHRPHHFPYWASLMAVSTADARRFIDNVQATRISSVRAQAALRDTVWSRSLTSDSLFRSRVHYSIHVYMRSSVIFIRVYSIYTHCIFFTCVYIAYFCKLCLWYIWTAFVLVQ